MKAVTVSFDRSRSGLFARLLKAFTNSWAMNATIPLDVFYTTAPGQNTRSYTFDANHFKLKEWASRIDGDTILVDSDMICVQDIACGFDLVDHIGICERRGKMPLNGGVIFVRDTPQAHAFIEQWIQVDERMMKDPAFHKPWHEKYAGMNQSSFGWMIENGYNDLVTILPEEYNHCEPWDRCDQAKMIHVKGQLRRMLNTPYPLERLQPTINLWHHYLNMNL